ncbi:hypothetical protein [Thiocystis violacea]|uniref:hypothetical protein n=1 Tax=Thiocystis violacea TaxID=13725 RepID=UPI001902FE8E|nr:hypothetical protein [Thiocystis violacea]MBK1716657.1 hypothetical protein [Thiocystis violacea]
MSYPVEHEAKHQDRIERLRQLEPWRPLGVPEECGPSAPDLLARLEEVYESVNDAACRRALPRDPQELVPQGRIAVVNPGAKPLRYRRSRMDEADDEDPAI